MHCQNFINLHNCQRLAVLSKEYITLSMHTYEFQFIQTNATYFKKIRDFKNQGLEKKKKGKCQKHQKKVKRKTKNLCTKENKKTPRKVKFFFF